MKFEEIKSILEAGDKEAISNMSSKIYNSTDINFLRELSLHVNEFTQLVSVLPVESIFRDYRYTSLLAGNLLSEISNGGCFCAIYKSAESTPESLVHRGVIEIITKEVDFEDQTVDYKCKCKVCEANFNVTAVPTAYFDRHVWRRMG